MNLYRLHMNDGHLTEGNMGSEVSCVASEPHELCRAIRAPQARATARDTPPTNKILKCEGNRNAMSGASVSSENTSADNSAAVANFTILSPQ